MSKIKNANDRCARIMVMKDMKPRFFIYVYGVSAEELMTVPNDCIAAIIRRRGLTKEEGYNSSPFMVEDVRPYHRNFVMESMVGRHP